MANGGKVNAQLVAAPGVRGKGDAGGRAVARQHLVAGMRRFAVLVADFLPWAPFPVGDKRVFDIAGIAADVAVNDGDVALLNAARGEFLFVMAFGGFVFGDKQQAAGCHVEAVRRHRGRCELLAATLYAVVFFFAPPRNGKQASGFVDDENVRVFVMDVEGHRCNLRTAAAQDDGGGSGAGEDGGLAVAVEGELAVFVSGGVVAGMLFEAVFAALVAQLQVSFAAVGVAGVKAALLAVPGVPLIADGQFDVWQRRWGVVDGVRLFAFEGDVGARLVAAAGDEKKRADDEG